MKKRKLDLFFKLIVCLILLTFVFNTINAQNCSVNAGVDFPVCANSVLTLEGGKSGLFQSSTQTNWSQVSGPSSVITDPSDLLSTVTSLTGGNIYRFRLSATCEDGSKVYDDVSITVNPITIANAGPDQVLCPGPAISNLAAGPLQVGEVGTWTVFGSNNGVTIVTANSPTSAINLNQIYAGNTTLRWSINNGSCSSFDDVVITNKGGVSIVSAGAAPSVSPCYSGTGISGNASASFGGITLTQRGLWTVINGPNIPIITSPNSNTTTFSNLIQGTYTLQWTVSGVCVNGSGQINLVVPASNGGVTAASILAPSSNATFCDGRTSTVLVGNISTKPDETVLWTKTSGAAGDIIESPNSSTTVVSGLNNLSSYTYKYSITNSNGCSSQDTRNISWTAPSSLSITSISPMILPCGNSSAIVNYTAGGSGTTQWMIVSGPTTPTYPSIPTGWSNGGASSAAINGLTKSGIYQIRFQKSAGIGSGCETVFQDFTIIVSQIPTSSNAGTDQVLACNVFNTNLVGNIPSVGVGSWSQVSGPSQASLTLPLLNNSPISGLQSGKYIFRWLISGGNSCPSFQDEVSVIVSDPSPTASAAGSDIEICNSTPIILTGNPTKLNEIGTWTVLPSAGIILSDIHSPNATATGMAPSTSYTFSWTIKNACGISTDDVNITTNATVGAIAAFAGNDQCLSSSTSTITMDGNNPDPGIGTWTIVSGGAGNITNPNQNNTTISGLSDGTYLFEWSISNNSCAITRDTVQVTISQSVAITNPANAGSDQDVCGTSATLNANNPAVGIGYWIQTAGSSGLVIQNPTLFNTSVSGLTNGAYKFKWNISNFACAGSSDEVQINITDPPTIADAGSSQSICSGNSVTMAANIITTGNGIWSIQEGPNSPIITNINLPNTTITGLIEGSYTFRWSSFNGAYCPASKSDVIIDVTQPANAGIDQQLCAANSANLTGNNSSIGTWAQVGAIPSIATINATASNSAIATDLIAGDYTFKYTYNSPTTCLNSDEISISIYDIPNQANAGPDQNICDINTVNMAANSATIGVGLWSRTSGPNSPTIGNLNSPTTFIGGSTALINGIYQYKWTITNGSCSTSDDLIITRGSSTTFANAGPDQSNVCGTSAIMAANSPLPGVGSWSKISGGAANITQIIVPTTSITGMNAGSYVFRWSITNGTCTPSTDDVSITMVANPTIANAGPDQNLCNAISTVLAGNPILIGTGLWSQISGPNVANIMSVNDPATVVNGLIPGNYVFKWTSSNGTCISSDNVVISISLGPTIANAGSNQDICLFSSINLNGNIPINGTGRWTQIGGSSAIILTPTSSVSAVTGVIPGNYLFRWTITNGTCPSSFDDVSININDIPSIAIAGNDQNLCNVSITNLTASEPSSGIGTWSVISGPNIPSISNIHLSTSGISDLIPGVYLLDWTVANGTCSSSDQVQITVFAQPTAANAGLDKGICGSNSVTLEGNTPTVGTGIWTKVSGPNSPTIQNSSLSNTTITNLITGTYVFKWTISNGSCSISNDNVQISVAAGSITSSNAGQDQFGLDLCGLTSTNLIANAVSSPETGFWTVISGNGGTFTNSSLNNSVFTGIPGVSYVIRWTISNGVCSSFDEALVKFEENPSTASASNRTDVSMCGITTTVLDGNIPIVGNGTWSIISGNGGILSNSLDPLSTFSGIAETLYTLKWTISNSPCNQSDVLIDVLFKKVPQSVITGIVIQPTCSISTGSVDLSGLPLSGTWTIIESVGLTSISGTGNTATFSGLKPDSYTFTVTNDAGCTSLASTNVVIDIQPSGPNIPVIDAILQPTCSISTGSVDLSGLPSTGTWTITESVGLTSITGTGNTATFSGLTANSYTFTVTNDIGCSSSASNAAVINAQPSIPTISIAAVSDPSICGIDGSFTMNFTNVPDGIYSILYDNGTFNNVNVVSQTATISTTAGIYNNLQILLKGCVSLPGTNVTLNALSCSDLSITKTINNSSSYIGENVVFTIIVTNNGPNDATNVIVTDNLPSGYLFVSASATVGNWSSPNWTIGNLSNGASESLAITAKVNSSGNYTNSAVVTGHESDPDLSNNEASDSTILNNIILIPEGISPNHDGKNDKWVIAGLEQYPKHKVIIFNRWGNKVYEASPYLNDWDGTNMFGLTVGGKELPVGTYFYVIDPGDGHKVIKGYIYLNR